MAGAYFITICSNNRECLFGNIARNEMNPSDYGKLAATVWSELPKHYEEISLDAFVVMPNHIHGIVVIDVVGAGLRPARVGLPEIVRAFKSFSTHEINKVRNNSGISVWQRNYYEHIIRNESELNGIRTYIEQNPANWQTDEENPNKEGGS